MTELFERPTKSNQAEMYERSKPLRKLGRNFIYLVKENLEVLYYELTEHPDFAEAINEFAELERIGEGRGI